jgi:ABC-2 type transport system permease protein
MKTGLIIKREYLSRVKKKSFIVMTILGPLLMAGIIFARFWLAMIPEETQIVQVIDDAGIFANRLESNKNVKLIYSDDDLIDAQRNFYKNPYDIIVYIPKNILESQVVQIFYKKQPALSTQELIKTQVKNVVEDLKLIASGIDRLQLEIIKTKITIQSTQLQSSGEQRKSNSEASFVLGFIGSMLIYFFIFLYGAQVMRGVIEEKTTRIVEVIISSVKPFELMMGKIIGIALVGLTQFLLWLVLTFGLVYGAVNVVSAKKLDPERLEQTMKSSQPMNNAMGLPSELPDPNAKDQGMGELKGFMETINLPVIIGSFLIFFLGGYLLYAALFAAVGAAVDSDADTQQFMLPITIPMILAITVSQTVVTNPESSLAFWFSMIPLTSPVIMMVRIPFGVPLWEISLSVILLIGGFLLATWISAKIYRTGILMYGKKSSYKELWKWLFYKD